MTLAVKVALNLNTTNQIVMPTPMPMLMTQAHDNSWTFCSIPGKLKLTD